MDSSLPDEEDREPVDQAVLDKGLQSLRTVIEGNGFDPEKITIKDFEGEVLRFEAFTTFKISPRIGEKTLPGRERGEVVGSLSDARAKMHAFVGNVSVNPEIREYARTSLEKREDLGFAVKNLSLRVDRLNKQYVVHSACGTCGADGLLACKSCRGSGRARCNHCNGQREVFCNVCSGQGQVTTPEGRHQCSTCHGRGRSACLICHQSGEVPCTQCNASGQTRCQNCKATGWISNIFFLTFDIRNLFDYQRDELPEPVPPLIDSLGPEMVTENHAEIAIVNDTEREKTLDKNSKPDELVILYDVALPWGDIEFDFADKPVKAQLFGNQGELVNLPPVIEKTASAGIAALKSAAQSKKASPADAIQKGARYRIIRETLYAGARYRKKQAFTFIKEKYPIGIREEALKALTLYADQALKNVTRNARLQGLAGGLVLTACLYALYHIGPVRTAISPLLPLPAAMIAVDVLVVAFGSFITIEAIRYAGVSALRAVLGDLIPDKEKKKAIPKSGTNAVWGIAGGLILFLIMIEAGHYLGQELPDWYAGMRGITAR